MNCRRLRSILGALLLALLAGCGDKLATYPVSGTVTLANGEPLEGATVSMESVEHSHSATGRTGPAGRFVMSTFETGDGMPLGTYRAVVLPPVGVDADAPEPPRFDPKYSSYETSGLRFTVEAAVDDLKIRLE